MSDEHHPEQIAHDVADIRADVAYERDQLDASIKHDYSTTETGVVPLDKRRPMWHFMGLWTTFVAGFSYMFLGFEIRDGGHSLASTVGITLLGYGIYVAYAMFGSYLGSRTGQTYGLLTRSVFGSVGSVIVCLFVLIAPLGWVAFQANLLVTLWDGFYGWGHIFTLTLVVAGLMIFNNLLGFTGISVFARYLVTPLLILWGAVHGDQGLRRRQRLVQRDAEGQRPAALGRRRRRDRLLDVGERAGLLALRQAEVLVADLDVPVRRGLVHAVHDGRLDDGRARELQRLGDDLQLHRQLLAVRLVLARVDHRDGQPGGDQRRQLLRVGQRRAEPRRRLEALAPPVHGAAHRRRRRDRGRPRQLPLPQRLVQGGDVPRHLGAVGDGDHGRRPLRAAADLQDLAAADGGAGLGGGRLVQLAGGDRAARGRLLRRHRLGELAERVARTRRRPTTGAPCRSSRG